jgi:arylsulfatase A-like enzyme
MADQNSKPAKDTPREDRTGNSLPLETPPFRGTIGDTYKTSTSDFPQPIRSPAGAPNVLLVLVDDLGFGGTSIFGGLVPTPNIDRLGAAGLRYNAFHNTALCSPTRAALLTGRNHHQCGMGGITEGATGFPGYDSVWGQDLASIAEVLRGHGYNTAAFGKWHDTPDWQTSSAGSFEQWPTGKGFNTFYGFQGGETNQWYPQLYRNIEPVEPPRTPEQGYHLTADIADEAVAWIRRQESIAPDNPWFVYWAPGAMHAPHHAPKEFIDRFRGRFDMGWDQHREAVFANQLKLGVIPADAKLSARPEGIPVWDALSDDERKLFARQMEVFAGFLAHLDEHLGRVIDAATSGPNGQNTLVILSLGDNGCSAEGGLHGTINNMAAQNGFPDDVATMLSHIDELGGPEHENHFSVGWAWSVDCPFQWTKQVASHFGGTRTGLIIHWPAKITAAGVRSQFHHVIDIAPTIYEAVGITMPDSVNGVSQVPLAGVSMAYTYSDPAAAGRHTTQYFEIMGNRAIYHDGWIASARHGVPWVLIGKKGDFENDKWELYDLASDFSQAIDVSEQHPDKLAELQALFEAEATKYDVFPLDDRFAERGQVANRPSVSKGRKIFTLYPGTVRVPEGSAPNLKMKSHRITAEFEVPEGGCEGVIVCCGGGSGGYSLFIKDGRLTYENNFFSRQRDVICAAEALPSGTVTAVFDYVQEGKEWGEGGSAALSINGVQVGATRFAHVVPVRFSATETFDIGEDRGAPASDQYVGPFKFTGALKRVVIEIDPADLHAERRTKAAHDIRVAIE